MTAPKTDNKKATDAAKPKAACPSTGACSSNAASCGGKKENAPAVASSGLREYKSERKQAGNDRKFVRGDQIQRQKCQGF